MLLEAEKISHLARLRNRGEHANVGKPDLIPGLAHHIVRVLERGLAGIDEGQHVAEMRRSRLCCREVAERLSIREQGSDMTLA
jgi:hypothetical protein